MSIAERVADAANLYRAWEVVRDNDLEDGEASPGTIEFEADLTGSIERLRTQLLDGSYKPGCLTRVAIPKRDGGERVLRIPSVRDRVAERAISQTLSALLDHLFSPWSFGFRPGLGVEDAIEALVGLREEGAQAVVRGDFRDFFDTLARPLLLECLSEHLPDPWLLDLVDRLLARPSRRPRRQGLERTSRGAPQGGPLSPLLGNVYLHRFDEAMLAHGIPVVRYADDFAVPVQSVEEAVEVRRLVTEQTHAVALSLAEEKTYVTTFSEGFPFLGVEIGDVLPVADPESRLSAPGSKIVYVGVQGSTVNLRQGQLRVVHRDEILLSVPVSHVGQLVTFGSVGISAGLRDYALWNRLEVTLCSRRGGYRGRFDGPGSRATKLRREQFRKADCPTFALDLARMFIAGKVANQRALLLRYARRTSGAQLVETAKRLEELRSRALAAKSAPALLGIEGSGARAYFSAWPLLLPDEVRFSGRNRRPPRDPVNAALSFGYVLLTTMAIAGLVSAGLDHDVGFLHADDDTRPSLALDLMEEFRPVVVDTVVLECFRRRMLQADDFKPADRGEGLWLAGDARSRFLEAFEQRMLTLFSHVPSRQRTSYRRALFLQARQIANVVRGVQERYQPISWR